MFYFDGLKGIAFWEYWYSGKDFCIKGWFGKNAWLADDLEGDNDIPLGVEGICRALFGWNIF